MINDMMPSVIEKFIGPQIEELDLKWNGKKSNELKKVKLRLNYLIDIRLREA